MAVVVVGDIDAASAEALIKKHFAGLTNPTNERTREIPTVPAYTTNKGLVLTDKEATNYTALLAYSAAPKKNLLL
jgi:zinc protease